MPLVKTPLVRLSVERKHDDWLTVALGQLADHGWYVAEHCDLPVDGKPSSKWSFVNQELKRQVLAVEDTPWRALQTITDKIIDWPQPSQFEGMLSPLDVSTHEMFGFVVVMLRFGSAEKREALIWEETLREAFNLNRKDIT